MGDDITKQYHVNDCPDCRFNNDNFCCMNTRVECRPSEYERMTQPIAGFTVFKGQTTKRCHRKKPKEKSEKTP